MNQNLTFELLKKDSGDFEPTKKDSYLRTYPHFIKYFKSIDQITEHNLVIASHFVYGWMPTIINLDLTQKDKIIALLNTVKNGHLLTPSELELLKKAINNSVVGLSKLLHFINPENYAIWDSRIFRYITGKKSDYGIGNVEYYMDYLLKIKEISKNEDYLSFHDRIAKKCGYEIHPTRAIEIVMFETDKKRQLELRKDKFVTTSIKGLKKMLAEK